MHTHTHLPHKCTRCKSGCAANFSMRGNRSSERLPYEYDQNELPVPKVTHQPRANIQRNKAGSVGVVFPHAPHTQPSRFFSLRSSPVRSRLPPYWDLDQGSHKVPTSGRIGPTRRSRFPRCALWDRLSRLFFPRAGKRRQIDGVCKAFSPNSSKIPSQQTSTSFKRY